VCDGVCESSQQNMIQVHVQGAHMCMSTCVHASIRACACVCMHVDPERVHVVSKWVIAGTERADVVPECTDVVLERMHGV
jgi:hypothetical protein